MSSHVQKHHDAPRRHRARSLRAAATVPLAVAAVVAAPFAQAAQAVEAGDGSESADTSAARLVPAEALIRPDGRLAVAPAYGDVRSLLPGAEVTPTVLSPRPGLLVRQGLELEPRTTAPSRSSLRSAAGPELARVKVEDRRWAREDMNVRSGPGKRFDAVTTLDFRDGIGVTGLRSGDWLQVKREGRSLWVNRELIAKDRPPKPTPPPAPVAPSSSSSSSSGSSSSSSTASSAPASPASAVCSNGSSVSGGANVLAVHRAVCAVFPSITTYGTYRANSTNHASGRAIDVMVSGSTGYAVADYVRANAGSLGVSEVIWAQRIWTVERAGEGWRYMEDRGSSTANHYDHVHVSTY